MIWKIKKALSFRKVSSRELRVLETFFSDSRIEGVKPIIEEKISIILWEYMMPKKLEKTVHPKVNFCPPNWHFPQLAL